VPRFALNSAQKRTSLPTLDGCPREAAKILGVARHTLSRVLNGQAGRSVEMAIRLEKAGWSNAGQWMRWQAAYDLAQARQHESAIKVKRYLPQRAA
jgi:addiction module HigA family antidote